MGFEEGKLLLILRSETPSAFNFNGQEATFYMERDILRNERGVALVVSLVLLLVLTLIGFSSVNTTTFEANITGNERMGMDAFNAAEAGDQEALGKLPDTSAVPVTPLGGSAYYWSGGPSDRGAPAPIVSFGLSRKAGFDLSFAFRRYKINATAESSGATKEIESQVSYGPFSAGTSYNN
jgi:hypothetical protein